MRKIVKLISESMLGDNGEPFRFAVVREGAWYYAATVDALNPYGSISSTSKRKTIAEAEADVIAYLSEYTE